MTVRNVAKDAVPGREALGEMRKRRELLVRARDALIKAEFPVPQHLIDEISTLNNKTVVLDIPCLVCKTETVRYAVKVMTTNWPRAAVCATCASGDDPEAVVI